jgi:hypothetical protein
MEQRKRSKALWNDFEYAYQNVRTIEKDRDTDSKDLDLSNSEVQHFLDEEAQLTIG